jgi:hypothetical protein
MADVLPPADGSPSTARALTTVLAQLSATDVELTALTGGATAADVLAEFARASALELAQHFPDLPNQAFDGRVPQASGWRGWLRGARTLRHRVLAVRYTVVEPALSIGKTMLSYDVMGHLLAIGEDGALRTAEVNEAISIDASATIPYSALPFTDERVRNVPTSRATMRPWLGGNDPTQVAPPEAVLELLRLSATMLQTQRQVQGTLLRRLMGG